MQVQVIECSRRRVRASVCVVSYRVVRRCRRRAAGSRRRRRARARRTRGSCGTRDAARSPASAAHQHTRRTSAQLYSFNSIRFDFNSIEQWPEGGRREARLTRSRFSSGASARRSISAMVAWSRSIAYSSAVQPTCERDSTRLLHYQTK